MRKAVCSQTYGAYLRMLRFCTQRGYGQLAERTKQSGLYGLPGLHEPEDWLKLAKTAIKESVTHLQGMFSDHMTQKQAVSSESDHVR